MRARQQFEEIVPLASGAIEALEEFKSLESYKHENCKLRLPGMQTLMDKLCHIYEVPVRIRVIYDVDESPTICDGGLVYPLILHGRLSLVSLLNGFARIRQHVKCEPGSFVECQKWTINLFRKVFPRQFESLKFYPETGRVFTPSRVTINNGTVV